MTERNEPIVATLLTGFLGAGKTSLLNRLLSKPSLADTAVLINEFGEVGLDHLLVERIDGDIVLLRSGCICCTIRTDLKTAILSLFERMHRGEIRRFSRLVIETTGLADPVPILATLTADPMLKFHFRLGSVITVVDVPNGAGNIATYAKSARQVAVADRIVISKADLAGPTELAVLQRKLVAMNPAAETVVLAEASDLADALLLELVDRPADARRWVAAETAGWHHDHHDQHRHDVNQHGGIRAFVIEGDIPVAWPRFALWLSMLVYCHGPAMLRLKGLVDVEGAETPLVIQGVQHLIHKPVHLKAWPDGVRRTRIVVIGQGLDQALVQRSFEDFNFRRRRALSA